MRPATAGACNGGGLVVDYELLFPPPLPGASRTLAHARACGASMVLVVLEWDSQVWWPLMRDPVCGGWATFIHKCRHWGRGHNAFVAGRASGTLYFEKGVLIVGSAFLTSVSLRLRSR
jgi:hypothetical protein